MFGISLGPYILVCSLVCTYFLAMTYLNSNFLRNMTLPGGARTCPMVSVLIPARNEEHNIRNCLNSLLAQDYPNYEILVIDDSSSDLTGEIIEGYAVQHRNIRAYRGKELPEGWNGKPFACQQLAQHARGEYLFFTDADTVHSPQSISWAVGNAIGHHVDCLSALPRHEICSLGESLVVPLIYLMTSYFMPLWLIPRRNSKVFSFAIGQFILCQTNAFWSVGGFNGIANSLVEDMALVKRMKASGFKTIFLDAKNHIQCRMYIGFKGSVRGIVKSVYAALNQNTLALAGMWLLIVFAVELPFVNFLYQVLSRGRVLLSSIPVIIFFASWYKTLSDRKIGILMVFLYPIIFFNLLWLSMISLEKTGYGRGTLWKGRIVRCLPPESELEQDILAARLAEKER